MVAPARGQHHGDDIAIVDHEFVGGRVGDFLTAVREGDAAGRIGGAGFGRLLGAAGQPGHGEGCQCKNC